MRMPTLGSRWDDHALTRPRAKLGAGGGRDFTPRAEMLRKAVADREHLLGAELAGAGILICDSRFMANFMGLLSDHPVLEAYYARLQQRPTHRRAYGG